MIMIINMMTCHIHDERFYFRFVIPFLLFKSYRKLSFVPSMMILHVLNGIQDQTSNAYVMAHFYFFLSRWKWDKVSVTSENMPSLNSPKNRSFNFNTESRILMRFLIGMRSRVLDECDYDSGSKFCIKFFSSS